MNRRIPYTVVDRSGLRARVKLRLSDTPENTAGTKHTKSYT